MDKCFLQDFYYTINRQAKTDKRITCIDGNIMVEVDFIDTGYKTFKRSKTELF
ncbi:MAG: hypothetical protein PHW90_03145 [Bacilli bacterium]|nr:hypothetical protein [Bacilli bacterium]